jgi:hypothetical protein
MPVREKVKRVKSMNARLSARVGEELVRAGCARNERLTSSQKLACQKFAEHNSESKRVGLHADLAPRNVWNMRVSISIGTLDVILGARTF